MLVGLAWLADLTCCFCCWNDEHNLERPYLEDPFHYSRWDCYGFPFSYGENGQRLVDWPKTLYQHRSTEVRFARGDTQSHWHCDSSPECADKWIKTEYRIEVYGQSAGAPQRHAFMYCVCVHVVGLFCLPCINKWMLQLFKNNLLQHHLADGRSFMAWKSHLTVTAFYITPEWEMKSPVLQTGPIYDLQIRVHIRQRN